MIARYEHNRGIVSGLYTSGNTRILSGRYDELHVSMSSPAITRLTTLLAVAYPLLAHWAAVRNSLPWTIAALGALTSMMLLPAMVRGSWRAWLMALIIGGTLWLLSRLSLAMLPLYIAPVLMPTFLACLFGASLQRHSTPLIEQVIRVMHADEAPPRAEVWQYARRLTQLWTLMFIALALTNLLLAWCAEPDGLARAAGFTPWLSVPKHWWSSFANLIGYLLVAACFVIEYAYRRHRFPEQPDTSLFDFLRRLSHAMPQLIARRQ